MEKQEKSRGGRNNDKVIVKGGEESMVCGNFTTSFGKLKGRERSAKVDNGGLSPSFWTGDPGREGVGRELSPRQKHSQWAWGPGGCPSLAALLEGAGGGCCEGAASHGRSRSAGHTPSSGPWR